MMKYVQKDFVRERLNRDLLRKSSYSDELASSGGDTDQTLNRILPAPCGLLISHSCSYSTAIGLPDSLREVMSDTTASVK
jgi:hypothetical protein